MAQANKAGAQGAGKGWTKDALVKLGFTLAHDFMNAEEKLSQTKRELLLNIAKEHAGDTTHIVAILDGYAQGYVEAGVSDGIVKSRKTEAKAVFDAVAKTMVTGENMAKLQEFEGGFHEWVSLARELRGLQERSSSPKDRRPVMTTKQQEQIEKKIEAGTPGQLQEIASTAMETQTKHAAPTLAGFQSFLLIQSTCHALLDRKDVEESFHKAAEAVLVIVNEQIEHAQIAMKAAADIQKSKQVGAVPVANEQIAEKAA